MPVDFESEVARLRKKRMAAYRKRWGRSRLDRYGPEILNLHEAGATLAEIQLWLAERRLRVHVSTIQRWIKKHAQEQS